MDNLNILNDALNYIADDITYYKNGNGYLGYIQELETIITALKDGITTDFEELKLVSGLIRKAEIYLDKAKALQREFEIELVKDAENEFRVSKNTRITMKKAKKRLECANEKDDFGLNK